MSHEGSLYINGRELEQPMLDFEEIEYEVVEYIQVQQSKNNFRSFAINLKSFWWDFFLLM